jgi:hypothetical protein
MSTEGKLNECIRPSLYDYPNYLKAKIYAEVARFSRAEIQKTVPYIAWPILFGTTNS